MFILNNPVPIVCPDSGSANVYNLIASSLPDSVILQCLSDVQKVMLNSDLRADPGIYIMGYSYSG